MFQTREVVTEMFSPLVMARVEREMRYASDAPVPRSVPRAVGLLAEIEADVLARHPEWRRAVLREISRHERKARR